MSWAYSPLTPIDATGWMGGPGGEGVFRSSDWEGMHQAYRQSRYCAYHTETAGGGCQTAAVAAENRQAQSIGVFSYW